VAVGFWNLNHPSAATAVVLPDNRLVNYKALALQSDGLADALAWYGRRTLSFLLCRNGAECLAAYLGALRSGHVACLLDTELQPELFDSLLETYKPDFVFTPCQRSVAGYAEAESPFGFLYRRDAAPCDLPLAPDLALLLPTSGSTGSPKLVRLSLKNLQANAESIISYLQLSPEDRGLTSLPMSYSYGLSIVNTHLLAGGRLLVTNGGFLQRDYWDFVSAQRASSIAGVPYHYEVMLSMRMLEKDLPGLRLLTQAGGHLSADRVSQLERLCFRRGWQFFVMYGQTEATARIAYVPPAHLQDKPGSIGVAIPGGTLSLDADTGELLYRGPNVMLGYAETRSDLGKADELGGQLRTGDLARRDEEGFYYITGRLKRFLKVFGKRFSLDEMEEILGRHGCGALACFGTDDHIVVALQRRDREHQVAGILEQLFKIHPSAFRIVNVDVLPRFPNSKIDYQSLARLESSR
jgi:acyl-CoA synthetase (AMP-forming)/AMP-acid ligase II